MKDAFKTSPTNHAIEAIQTRPERIADMPYAPAMRVKAGATMLYISGATLDLSQARMISPSMTTRPISDEQGPSRHGEYQGGP